jgi:hypothetical protein
MMEGGHEWLTLKFGVECMGSSLGFEESSILESHWRIYSSWIIELRDSKRYSQIKAVFLFGLFVPLFLILNHAAH